MRTIHEVAGLARLALLRCADHSRAVTYPLTIAGGLLRLQQVGGTSATKTPSKYHLMYSKTNQHHAQDMAIVGSARSFACSGAWHGRLCNTKQTQLGRMPINSEASLTWRPSVCLPYSVLLWCEGAHPCCYQVNPWARAPGAPCCYQVDSRARAPCAVPLITLLSCQPSTQRAGPSRCISAFGLLSRWTDTLQLCQPGIHGAGSRMYMTGTIWSDLSSIWPQADRDPPSNKK